MPKLEKDLEARCRALARSCDGELLKFTPPQKGWHDRLLLLPTYMALIEFKRVKKAKVQPLQNDRQAWCEARRIPAFRVWDYSQFCDIINVATGRNALTSLNINDHVFAIRPRR
jgi:hypothetical protein